MQPILFTKEGYEKLKVEQLELVEKRKGAVETLSKARSMGDLSENGYYKAAKFELISIDRRIREVARLLRDGKVANAPRKDVVDIGSIIIIDDGKDKRTFQIVSEFESDPSLGKISYKSPLGSKLMGKKVGDRVTIESPKGTAEFTIEKIK